ncbi:cell surface A33 antigen-like [Anableps anableps]
MEKRIVTLALLCVVWSAVAAINVNIPKDQYEFARGDNITLPCTFTSTQKNPSLVIISWSGEGPNTSPDETLILTHYHPGGETDVTSKYEGRVSVDVSTATGKANLKLSSITMEDNKEFECRIQIPGDDEGKPADVATLTVLVAPSKPICKIQGKAEYGQNINLTCYSEEGSPPPTYKWESSDVRNMPRIADPRTTDKGGILSLYNISRDTSGYYTCTSSNKIRSASCNITLTVLPPSMNIGSTAAIIGGVVAALIILIIIIYCCCCRKKDDNRENYAMSPVDDKEAVGNGESPHGDGEAKRRDNYEERSERNYDRRSDYHDRRSDYDDRRSDYDDRRSDYNDRRKDYDDRRSDYDDRRSNYDDRRSDYDDRRSKHSDRHERYDDDRRYDDERRNNDRRDARFDDDRNKP